MKIAMVQPELVTPGTGNTGAARKSMTLKELQAALGLTDKQTARLVPIMKEKAAKRKEVLKKYAGKGEAAKPALIKELMLFKKYYDDMYSHIFTEAQWNKYLVMRQEQKNK